MGAPTHASACFHQESARNLLQYCFIWAAAYIRGPWKVPKPRNG
jgi:hypothetical protein